MDRKKKVSRRSVLHGLAAGGAVVSLSSLGGLAWADSDRVSVDEPTAKAVHYVEDASEVDASKHPRFAEGQLCSNCILWQAGPDDAWGGCGIFGGRKVAGPGWCTAWVAKP